MDTVVAGMVSGVANSVGQQSDAASSTGSVNAKLASLVNTVQKARSIKPPVTFTTTSTSYVTALSVTGRGRIRGIYLRNADGGGNTTTYCRVTVDGTVIITPTVVNTTNRYIDPIGADLSVNGPIPFDVNFKSSFLVEVYTSNASYAATTGISYEIE